MKKSGDKPRLTLEEMYNHLFDSVYTPIGTSSDTHSRVANIFAVKNTVKEWRKQFET